MVTKKAPSKRKVKESEEILNQSSMESPSSDLGVEVAQNVDAQVAYPQVAISPETKTDSIGGVEPLPKERVDASTAIGHKIVDPELSVFSVKLSDSLQKKLRQQAYDEGLAIEDYVEELLAEAVVLRAWEIVEKKMQLRGGAPSNGSGNAPHQGNRNHRGNRRDKSGGGGGGNRRGMSNSRYQSIMDDKANFLEYVRNQERKGNR